VKPIRRVLLTPCSLLDYAGHYYKRLDSFKVRPDRMSLEINAYAKESTKTVRPQVDFFPRLLVGQLRKMADSNLKSQGPYPILYV